MLVQATTNHPRAAGYFAKRLFTVLTVTQHTDVSTGQKYQASTRVHVYRVPGTPGTRYPVPSTWLLCQYPETTDVPRLAVNPVPGYQLV
eukprot:2316900-Rhodomonas_salina.1